MLILGRGGDMDGILWCTVKLCVCVCVRVCVY